jgi:hypothetical protein
LPPAPFDENVELPRLPMVPSLSRPPPSCIAELLRTVRLLSDEMTLSL